jgi:hypothetical protein
MLYLLPFFGKRKERERTTRSGLQVTRHPGIQLGCCRCTEDVSAASFAGKKGKEEKFLSLLKAGSLDISTPRHEAAKNTGVASGSSLKERKEEKRRYESKENLRFRAKRPYGNAELFFI